MLQTITNDNFELGCTIIERSATDKAIRDINERLAPAFQARQKATAAGQNYFDTSMLQGRFPKALPEALRPKAGHMNPQQERVYEDFARIPKQPSTATAVAGQIGLQSSGPGSPLNAATSEKVSAQHPLVFTSLCSCGTIAYSCPLLRYSALQSVLAGQSYRSDLYPLLLKILIYRGPSQVVTAAIIMRPPWHMPTSLKPLCSGFSIWTGLVLMPRAQSTKACQKAARSQVWSRK